MSPKSTLVPFGTGAGVSLRLLSAPIAESSRVREPVRRTTGRVVGYFPSVKNNRLIAWESQLEQKACYIFEFSTEITSFREQPLTVNYRCNGKILRYTPDFELRLINGELAYVEVKPAIQLSNPQLQEKITAIKKYWEGREETFIVLTEHDLGNSILHSNLKLLRSYLRMECDPALIKISKHWLTTRDGALLKHLIDYLQSQTKAYCLLAHQFVSIDLLKQINPSSNIFPCKE